MEIKSVQFGIQLIRSCLDEIERSTASFAPIWVQQGGVGTWMVPASQLLLAPTPALAPWPIAGPIAGPTAGPTAGLIAGPTARLTARLTPIPRPTPKPIPKPTSRPTLEPTPGPTPKPTSRPTATPTSTYISSLPPLPFILDPNAPPRPYKMLRGSNSVFQLWTK